MSSAFSYTGMANPKVCKWGENCIFVQKNLYFEGGDGEGMTRKHVRRQETENRPLFPATTARSGTTGLTRR